MFKNNKQNDNDVIQQLAEEILILKQNKSVYSKYAAKMDQLFRLIQPKLNYYIYKFFNSQIDREDVLSNTMEKIFIKFYTYKPEFRFTTWIHTIAKNESLIYRQKNKIATVDIDNCWDVCETHDDYIIDDIDNEMYDYAELASVRFELIHMGIMRGNLNYQMICEKEFNGKTCKDIAVKYNTNENTVKTKIRAARFDMQRLLRINRPELLNN